ncbi:MAG: aminoacyl-tRNA hydrolase [Pantanalinema sp. GBBB05]|nr:aminoacyl-tRNA hydrolase [Pantanalinema sp. GBBB05]
MAETQVVKDTAAPKLIIPQLIVGLGNPGTKYDRTRHNIGFEVVDALAQAWQIGLAENRKFQGIYGEGSVTANTKIRLLKPQTYMNNSGQAIRAVIDWYKLPPEAVLVVYDDMDLPVGKLRLRVSGSAGGHNGMKSTIAHLGTQAFPRLRVGIGSAKDVHPDKDTVSHVLGQFSASETKRMAEVLEIAVSAIELSLKQGVEKAMSLYNNRTVTDNKGE